MGTQPCREGRRLAVRQQVDDAPALQIHEHGAVPLPATERPIIDAEHAWRRGLRRDTRLHAREHGARCARQTEGHGHACARASAQGETEQLEHRRRPHRAPCVACGRLGHALGEDAARTAGRVTEESAHGDHEPHPRALARQVRQRAAVPTVHAGRWRAARRAGHGFAPGDRGDGDEITGDGELLDVQLRARRAER